MFTFARESSSRAEGDKHRDRKERKSDNMKDRRGRWVCAALPLITFLSHQIGEFAPRFVDRAEIPVGKSESGVAYTGWCLWTNFLGGEVSHCSGLVHFLFPRRDSRTLTLNYCHCNRRTVVSRSNCTIVRDTTCTDKLTSQHFK